MNVLISGISGHMGHAVYRQCVQMGLTVCCGVDLIAPEDIPVPVHASFAEVTEQVDVIIDFSKPACLSALLDYMTEKKVPAVIATTGFDEAQLAAIDEAAKQVAIFRSANMSIGVALLRELSRRAAEVLGETFDIEIVEAHHNRKVDAPSGTALMLYDAISEAFDQQPPLVGGRYGRDTKRQKGEVTIHALRGGTVIGEHEVCFFGPMERIKLSHSAEDRSVFAVGALRAGVWLAKQEPGLYNMDDMLKG